VLRQGKHILLPVARLCLISTFIDDGLRMWLQWTAQCNFMDATWSCGWFIAMMFIFLNLVSQLSCCIMVLARIHVGAACGILFAVIAVQVCSQNCDSSTHSMTSSFAKWKVLMKGLGRTHCTQSQVRLSLLLYILLRLLTYCWFPSIHNALHSRAKLKLIHLIHHSNNAP